MTTSTQNLTERAVTLGRTAYTVTVEQYETSAVTYLTGPRGAVYFLRPFLGRDDGLRQVISARSGAPLRVRGNEVRVYEIGDAIEVAGDFR